jgi:hypothetical protein
VAHRRALQPQEIPRGPDLTRALVGIGMLFAARAQNDANIEDTLLAASHEAVEKTDLRVLSVLVVWIETHHQWINADRLVRLVLQLTSHRQRAFWSAMATWLETDRRFARLRLPPRTPRVDLLSTGTDFQVKRRGEDPRFASSPLRVPSGTLRDRAADVLSPAELAKRHKTYRQRVLMGPSYRADMWAAILAEPTLSAAELARRTYGSFATAWQVKRDFAVLRG